MRHLPISLIILGLLFTAYGQMKSAGGYDQVVIAANQDPQSCLLHLASKLSSDHILFQEDVYNPYSDCGIKDLQLASAFDNSIVGTLTMQLADASNPLVYETTLDFNVLKQYNGSACVQIYPGQGDNVYICRFKYGEVFIQFWFQTDEANTVIRTNWHEQWFTVPFSTVLIPQNFTNVWKPSNQSSGNIIGHLGASCGGSHNIQSQNSEVWVTGTIQNGPESNLGALLNGYQLYSAVVRPYGAAAGNYVAKWTSGTPFNSNQTGTCSDLGFTYDAIEPNMNDCRNGCDVTFFMITSNSIYTLLTQGFTYTGSLRA